jgi:hypothetical protein
MIDIIIEYVCAFIVNVIVTWLIHGTCTAIDDNTKPVSAKRALLYGVVCVVVTVFIIYLD